jgi:hypothetical protein
MAALPEAVPPTASQFRRAGAMTEEGDNKGRRTKGRIKDLRAML